MLSSKVPSRSDVKADGKPLHAADSGTASKSLLPLGFLLILQTSQQELNYHDNVADTIQIVHLPLVV